MGFSLAGLGVSVLVPLGLALGLATVLLYILRVRRRGVTVPFVAVWEKLLLERKASTLRSRLRRYLSLLLHLLLLLLLLLALGDPRPDDERAQGRTIAVLVDVSASMAGRADGRQDNTLLGVAQQRMAGWLEGLGQGDRMLLVEVGARPRPVTHWTNSRSELREAIENLEVLDTDADFQAALSMAADALGEQPRAEAIVVSDGRIAGLERLELPKQLRVSYEHVVPASPRGDEGAANVGISAFSGRRYPLDPERYEVLIEVFNAGQQPAEVELSIFETNARQREGSLIELTRLTLQPGQRRSKTLSELSQVEQGLVARVERIDGGADLLPSDDVARALLEPLSPLRVLVVGEASTFLEAALLLDPSLVVERMGLESYPPAKPYDLTIFSGVSAERPSSSGPALYLGVPPDAQREHYPVGVAAELDMFGFDRWDEKSAVFRFFDPYDIQVLDGHSLQPEPEDRVLGYSRTVPILVAGERKGGRFMALGFSPTNSDFVMRAAWPLFVQNAVRVLAPRTGGETELARQTGQLWRARLADIDSGRAEVRGPLQEDHSETFTVPVQSGEAKWFGREAGFYEVVTADSAHPVAASFFDQGELEHEPNDQLRFVGGTAAAVAGFDPRQDRQPWFWLLAIVLIASFVEWWTYHRRWTV